MPSLLRVPSRAPPNAPSRAALAYAACELPRLFAPHQRALIMSARRLSAMLAEAYDAGRRESAP